MPSSQGILYLLLPGSGTRDTASQGPLYTQFMTWDVLDLPGDENLFLLSIRGPAIVTVSEFPSTVSFWFAWWGVGVIFGSTLTWVYSPLGSQLRAGGSPVPSFLYAFCPSKHPRSVQRSLMGRKKPSVQRQPQCLKVPLCSLNSHFTYFSALLSVSLGICYLTLLVGRL